MKQVFDYVIFYDPEDNDNGEVPVIIDRGSMLESDDRTVLIKVSRLIPDVYLNKLDKVKITIRPF